MKPLVVREIDNLGRIVIPIEYRKINNLPKKTPMVMFVNDDGDLVLTKFKSCCSLCGKEVIKNDLKKYMEALLCDDCYNHIVK